MAGLNESLDPFAVLKHDLYKELTNDDFKQMVRLCQPNLSKRRSSEFESAFELLDALEEVGLISSTKLSFLIEILEKIKRADLTSKVKEYLSTGRSEAAQEDDSDDDDDFTFVDCSPAPDRTNGLSRSMNVTRQETMPNSTDQSRDQIQKFEHFMYNFAFIERLEDIANNIPESLQKLKDACSLIMTPVGKYIKPFKDVRLLLLFLYMDKWITEENTYLLLQALKHIKKGKLAKELNKAFPKGIDATEAMRGQGLTEHNTVRELAEFSAKISGLIPKISSDGFYSLKRLIAETESVPIDELHLKNAGDVFMYLYVNEDVTCVNMDVIEELLVQVGHYHLVKKLTTSLETLHKVASRLYTCTPEITMKNVKDCISDLHSTRGLDKNDLRAIKYCNKLVSKNQKLMDSAQMTVFGNNVTVTFIAGNDIKKKFDVALDEDDEVSVTTYNLDEREVVVRTCDTVTVDLLQEVEKTYKDIMTEADKQCISFSMGLIRKLQREHGKEVLKNVKIAIDGKEFKMELVAGKGENEFKISLNRYGDAKYEEVNSTFTFKAKNTFTMFRKIFGLVRAQTSVKAYDVSNDEQ